MKFRGFRVGRFPTSSPNCYGVVRKSHFLDHEHSPPLFLSIFRSFYTVSVSNCNPHEEIKDINFYELGDALLLYEKMSTMTPLPSVIRFNQLLSQVVNLQKYPTAIRLFKDICSLGVSINDHTMNIAINCYCLLNRVDYGFSILGWFFKRGCVPDAITFILLLKGLFRVNRINEAQDLFRKMVREELCEITVDTYGTMIDGLCKSGNTALAIELFRVMEKGSCKPDTQIYNMLIDGLRNDDKMRDSVLNLFDEMSEKGITRNYKTYCSIRGLLFCLRFDMKDSKIYPSVKLFNTLIDGFCKEGMVEDAQEVFDGMTRYDVIPDVVSHNALMDRYCLEGRMDEARNVFDSLTSMNIAHDIRSYNILINGYCKKLMIDDAMHIFREVMPGKEVEPDVTTYNSILQGLFGGGRCSAALEIFDELQAIELKPDFHTYCNMLDGLCGNGEVERALSLLGELEQKGEHRHISYYSIMMDGLCKAKNLDAARDIFRDLPSKGLEPDVVAYNVMAQGCCRNGFLEEAQDFFLRMEAASFSPDRMSYNLMLQGKLKKGEYDDAWKLFEEMRGKGISTDSSTFELLLELVEKRGPDPTIYKIIHKL